ncbi:MAG: hypothetical protein KJ000_15510 [Pirellulaceae bacterium]|nr:hypothetical protein [Pirellulaceae bacterium]
MKNMIAMRKKPRDGCCVYKPTREDIRRGCEEIQATWSPQQRAKRNRRTRATFWTLPLIRLSDLDEAFDGEWADRS